jgi:hypothetical protein
MRVVLRDTRTGLYLQNTGHWTEDVHDAQFFRHSAEAMNKARDDGLRDLEVMLVFEEPQHDHFNVSLPLPPG